MIRRAASAVLVLGVAGIASCDPIEARPLTRAPMNSCSDNPCDRYEAGPSGAARCGAGGRCEVISAGGRPSYPFWIVVHVPETSFFAPGLTYVMFSDERGAPAFTRQGTAFCQPPQCLRLDNLTASQGQYLVSRQAWEEARGFGLPQDLANVSVPVRVVYEPTGNTQRDPFARTLPLDVLFDSSRHVDNGDTRILRHGRALPAGSYLRTMYPQPPFDEVFPPTRDVQSITQQVFVDTFTLLGAVEALPPGVVGVKRLDAPAPREAVVRREEGLDGWRVWLVDSATQQRISVVKTLSGKEAAVRLDTTGEPIDGDNVEAVVAPPASFAAVPRFVSFLPGGAGLKNLDYPAIPPPVTVTGVVAQQGDPGAPLLGYPAKLAFQSTEISGRVAAEPLLEYATSLSTDDSGRFATVMPPGTYAVTIEPAEGTGYATSRQIVVVDRTVTALTLRPPLRTRVRGRVTITDGRPLAEAELIAVPDGASATGTGAAAGPAATPRPRPGRARVAADGTYAMDLDPGSYVFVVVPKNGTGFPRVARRSEIPATETELPDIRVPPPTRLAFTLRDSSPTANPIQRAIVRIFAAGAAAEPVEIGSAMTDASGAVEILLAQETP